MDVELNGLKMLSRASAHAYLKEKLEFPEYYGHNLDALYDLLAAREGELTIRVIHSHMLKELLGGYGEALLSTLREAEESNPNLHIIIS